jgi:hypothetical protein
MIAMQHESSGFWKQMCEVEAMKGEADKPEQHQKIFCWTRGLLFQELLSLCA